MRPDCKVLSIFYILIHTYINHFKALFDVINVTVHLNVIWHSNLKRAHLQYIIPYQALLVSCTIHILVVICSCKISLSLYNFISIIFFS